MSKSDTLHFSIGDWWRISSWFTFLESWTPRICLRRHWVGSPTIVMPPTSWGTMAILAGNMSWFCFQLLLRPRRREMFYWIIFFDDLHCCISIFWLARAPALMWSVFESGEGVSGPVVQPAVETHTHFITNGYLQMKHGHGQCNGIEMISRGLLNKSSLFCFSHYT